MPSQKHWLPVDTCPCDFAFVSIFCVVVGAERLTLIVEAIDSVDGGTLVVAPEQEEVLRILDLVGQQQADGLQGLFPPVYVVAQEQVVALRRKAPVLEEPKQVVVLPVDVTCRGERCDEMEGRWPCCIASESHGLL